MLRIAIILGPGSTVLFFGHHQEPQEGLYLHEAQELAEEMMKDHHLDGTIHAPTGFPNSQ